jgi:hypothetical protein
MSLTPALIFTIANNAILPFWLLLIVAPRWSVTKYAVHSALIPLLLGLTYAWLLWRVTLGGEGPQNAGFGSLAGVMALFSSPLAATLGWIHYLIFDLFIGAWESRDAQRRGIPHWAVIPCLLVTLFAGPIGLLVYLAVRAAFGRGGVLLAEQA